MIYTTLNKIIEHKPCKTGWDTLLKSLGKAKADDAPLSLLAILDSNGLDDTLWCLIAVPEYDKEWRLFAVFCARAVQHLMEDARSLKALDVAEAYANGLATVEELKSAGDAAYAAWRVARQVNHIASSAAAAAWSTIQFSSSARGAALEAIIAGGFYFSGYIRAGQEHELRRIIKETK